MAVRKEAAEALLMDGYWQRHRRVDDPVAGIARPRDLSVRAGIAGGALAKRASNVLASLLARLAARSKCAGVHP